MEKTKDLAEVLVHLNGIYGSDSTSFDVVVVVGDEMIEYSLIGFATEPTCEVTGKSGRLRLFARKA